MGKHEALICRMKNWCPCLCRCTACVSLPTLAPTITRYCTDFNVTLPPSVIFTPQSRGSDKSVAAMPRRFLSRRRFPLHYRNNWKNNKHVYESNGVAAAPVIWGDRKIEWGWEVGNSAATVAAFHTYTVSHRRITRMGNVFFCGILQLLTKLLE